MNFLDGKTINDLSFKLITYTHLLNSELDIENINVNGVDATECQSEDWWLATLDIEVLKSGIQPTIIANTSQEGRHVAVLKSEITPDFIENDESVLIIVYSMRSYNIYRLRFTTLPVMTLNAQDEITYADDVPVNFNGYSGYAHIRGQYSQKLFKKYYKITLEEKQSFLGMRKDDDWILYGGANDQERIRNVFSSNLWYESCAGNNSFGIQNGYEYRYIELFINGSYAGLYALGYKPDQKQFDIQDGEYLFSKTDWGESSYELHGSKTKENEAAAWNALNNDYLYDEASSIDLWLFTNLCVAMDNGWKNYYVALKKDNSNQFTNLCVAMDNGWKNYCVALEKNNSNQFTAVYSPWDLDVTWGNSYSHDAVNYTGVYSVDPDTPCEMQEGPVYELLADGDRDIIDKLQKRYAQLRTGLWSEESLTDMLNEYENIIFDSGAYRRDISRWADSTQQDPDLKLSVFKAYLSERLVWMDDYIAGL